MLQRSDICRSMFDEYVDKPPGGDKKFSTAKWLNGQILRFNRRLLINIVCNEPTPFIVQRSSGAAETDSGGDPGIHENPTFDNGGGLEKDLLPPGKYNRQVDVYSSRLAHVDVRCFVAQ
jgi:hypothetical protein